MTRLHRAVLLLVASAVLCMVAGVVIGQNRAPAARPPAVTDAKTLADIFVGSAQGELVVTLVKVLTVLVLLYPLNRVILAAMGFRRTAELIDQMLSPDGNDSPAILSASALFALAILVSGLPFTSFPNYCAYLLFKGGYALLLAVGLATLLLAAYARVVTPAHAEEQIRKPGTNAVALLIAASLLTAAVVV